jgi:putative ABC transport system substrate-binding protein
MLLSQHTAVAPLWVVTRTALAVALALGVLGAPLMAQAQQARKMPRLCFLTFDPGTSRSTRFDAFFQGLRDLGYVDGQTITIDYISADGHRERFPALTTDVCASRLTSSP